MKLLEQRDRLGGYTINRHVRSGSTGDLYLGRRIAGPGFAPTIVIKVLPATFYRDKDTSTQLDAEMIGVSRIDDPRVAKLEELGDDNGVRYIALEYARGFSLSDILAFYYERDRRIRPALAVYLAMQAALGLQATHETRDHKGNHLRLVHGSLTTKRVLITWMGHLKIVRFGFARVLADAELTSWEQLFRSPEMFDIDRVDARADVYSLAAVLLSSLARGGLPVLDGVIDRSAIAGALGRAEGIPPAVGDVVVSALLPRKEDRPTALAFYRALVDAMPDALKITPSDVARELAAIRLDREFATFAQDRSLVGASYIPPRMTEVPSPFMPTAPPTASSEAAIASEKLVVPRLPALPLLSSMLPGGAAFTPEPARVESAPASEPEPPIPPPLSSASLMPAVRVEYPLRDAENAPAPAAPKKALASVEPVAAPAPAPAAPIAVAQPASRELAPAELIRRAGRSSPLTIIIAIVIAFAAGLLLNRALH